MERYSDYLYRYAMMRLRDAAAAEDAVQETFLAGIRGLDSFDGRVEIKYWLRGILRNKVVDHIRREVRETKVEIDADDTEILDRLLFRTSGIPTTQPEGWKFNPRQSFDQDVFWEVFRRCLARLKTPMRQAVILKMLEEQSTEEACKALDIQPNHLWVLLHRARRQLKKCLETNYFDD